MKITEDYLKAILEPFSGSNFRLLDYAEKTNSLIIESAYENSFKFDINQSSIIFYVDGTDYYVEKELKENLRQSIHVMGFYTHALNQMDNDFENSEKYPATGENDLYNQLVKNMLSRFRMNLGKIYLGGIKTIEVFENGFRINGILFRKVS